MLPEKMKRVLLDIIDDLYNSAIFPSEWNEFLIAFIPKNVSNFIVFMSNRDNGKIIGM